MLCPDIVKPDIAQESIDIQHIEGRRVLFRVELAFHRRQANSITGVFDDRLTWISSTTRYSIAATV
jgi:hypothetical protein